MATTRRTLIIVAGAGHSTRHDPLLQRFCPHADRNDTPMHIYYYGILWQAGVHAELKIVYDHHRLEGETPQIIATESGWQYEQPVPVGLLVWQKHE